FQTTKIKFILRKIHLFNIITKTMSDYFCNDPNPDPESFFSGDSFDPDGKAHEYRDSPPNSSSEEEDDRLDDCFDSDFVLDYYNDSDTGQEEYNEEKVEQKEEEENKEEVTKKEGKG
ncbi:hypothetical protein AABB24_014366, partial [Solanum stoloniferum]